MRFGVLLRVKDLDRCRIFYRDVLKLGEPEEDSGFSVRFRLSEKSVLLLERSGAEYWKPSDTATFLVGVADPEKLCSELLSAGYSVDPRVDDRPSGDYYRCEDPEGNLFLLTQE